MMVTLSFIDNDPFLYESRLNRTLLKRCSESFLLSLLSAANDVKDVEALLFKYGLCDYCDFQGLNLEITKFLVESVILLTYKYPRLRSRVCFLGSKRGFFSALDSLIELDKNVISRFGVQYICPEEFIREIATMTKNDISSINYNDRSANIWAQAIGICGLFDAIILDEADFSGIGYYKLKENLISSASVGFHPVGCGIPQYIVYHECGHILDLLCGITDDPEYVEYFSSFGETRIKRELSIYGATNIKEFFAEAFAEYMCSDSPRDIARFSGDFLEKKYKIV